MRAGVAPIDLPFTCSDVDARGNRRWYVRLPGMRKVRLRAEPGSEEFVAFYWSVRRGEQPLEPRIQPPKPGTFRWIAQAYLASTEFKKLDRRLTQRPRQLIIDKLVEAIGDKPAVIPPLIIREGVRSRGYGAAKEFLTCLRAIYRVAMEAEQVGSDPTIGIKAPRPKVDGYHPWTPEERATYERRWPVGTKQHTAYALGIYTGQRISDAVLLGRPHLRDGRLHFTQKKNRARSPVRVDIPVVPPLATALTAWQGRGLTFLETDWGKPFTADGLSNAFRRWCDMAGLGHCTYHGLRKACGSQMAEAGCTPHEIMAVLGHTTHQQAALYTRAADRAVMADGGLGKVYGEQIVPAVEQAGTRAGKKS